MPVERACRTPSDFFQDLGSTPWSIQLVDALVAVQVEHQHGSDDIRSHTKSHRLGHAVKKQVSIRKMGQAVIVRQKVDFSLGCPLIRHILHGAQHPLRPPDVIGGEFALEVHDTFGPVGLHHAVVQRESCAVSYGFTHGFGNEIPISFVYTGKVGGLRVLE